LFVLKLILLNIKEKTAPSNIEIEFESIFELLIKSNNEKDIYSITAAVRPIRIYLKNCFIRDFFNNMIFIKFTLFKIIKLLN